MHFDWRRAAGLAVAAALVAVPASAQPAPAPAPETTPAPAAATTPQETLETPYQEAPATAPTAPGPTAPVAPQPAAPGSVPGHISLDPPRLPDTRPLLPIRAQRRLVLTGELGWNGLAGFGPVLSYYPNPHFAVDFGAGVSLMGWKTGVRGRYNFMTTPVTPFLGLGFNATSGWGEFTANAEDDPNRDPTRTPVTVNLKASYLVQGVVGMDFIHRHGFSLISCLGYSYLLNRDNYDILTGELTDEEKVGFRFAFKGGLVLSLSMGYAFE